ncbi:MAG: DNA polymerase IV, partial [Patescibacteria group bacterium]
RFQTVTVTCRFADFETHTYSHTLKEATSSLAKLKIEATRLLLPFLDHRKNPHGKLIRLIGLRIEKLK